MIMTEVEAGRSNLFLRKWHLLFNKKKKKMALAPKLEKRKGQKKGAVSLRIELTFKKYSGPQR